MHIELNKILVPTDFSTTAEQALLYAATLAERFAAHLFLLHVVEEIQPILMHSEGMGESVAQELRETMQRDAEARLAELPGPTWQKVVNSTWAVRTGIAYYEICRYAKNEAVDLIVLGTHGRTGLKHFLLGSVAERVVRSAPCPVLTYRVDPGC